MTYLERLNPWCIIRPFPNMRTLIIGRFRRRVDAERYLIMRTTLLQAPSRFPDFSPRLRRSRAKPT